MDARERLHRAAALACVLEAGAEKPGNVTPTRRFADVTFEDFVLSGLAVAPVLARAGEEPPGRLILGAVRATRQVTRANTNLGIVLLFVPLARAYALAVSRAGQLDAPALQRAVRQVLAGLSVEDARLAYEAIRLAAPGGLGSAPEHDVCEEPRVTLLEAMAAAAGRDTVAGEYASGFAVTFGTALPALREGLARGEGVRAAVTEAFLRTLAAVPDTLIARKTGSETAQEVSRWARCALGAGEPGSLARRLAVRRLDRRLRDRHNRLNPGTTADLVAAALFVHFLTAPEALALAPGQVPG